LTYNTVYQSPEFILRNLCLKPVSELFGSEAAEVNLQIQKTKREFEGQLTLVVFPLTKFSKKSPEETGKVIGEALVASSDFITGFNVVKGFLNLEFADSFWLSQLNAISSNASFGFETPGSKELMMVEFSSPNTNKPLHLGHLRNIFLGDSVSSILEAAGHPVVRVQIINDRGIHICKSMAAWKQFGKGETPESSGLKGDKLVGKYYVLFDKQFKKEKAALMAEGRDEEYASEHAPIMETAREMLRMWEAGDEETVNLWRRMNSWVYAGFDATYRAMGVTFDKLYYESQTYLLGKQEVMDGLARGVFIQKEDGSIWVDLTGDGLDEKILLRKDGTAVYITQDIGTAILRFKDYPGLAGQIYTVGNEQEYHFKVLFLILQKLGFASAGQNFHLSYGMVELPEGKMKSREGTVVDADDLMAEMNATAASIAAEQGKLEGLSRTEKTDLYRTIGLGALKYFLLKVDPKKNMLFNPQESVDFNGHTGPFIQYGYVRTRAILRKAEAEGFGATAFGPETALDPKEREIIIKLSEFPSVISAAAREYSPAPLANYIFELTKEFNTFYQSQPILKEANNELRSLRLVLAEQTGLVIKRGMDLLGIDMPERM
jgi:arginyl-tRNA synthetase